MPFDVAMPAGGEVRPDRVAAMGTRWKPLADLCGRPLAEWVVRGVRSSTQVGRVALVAGPPVLQRVGHLADLTVPDRGSGPANLLAALGALGGGRALITGCDAPLLNAAVIDDFLARAADIEADMHFSFVRAELFEAAYPGVPFLGIKVRGGACVLGSLHLVSAEFLLEHRERLEHAFDARKRPSKLLRMIGLVTVGKYATGLLTVADIERRVGRVLGCRCAAVECDGPEIAFDVDKPEHLEAARRLLAGRGPASP